MTRCGNGISIALFMPSSARVRGMLAHGRDGDRRSLAALAGPKRLILVSGARHNESLRGEVWTEVERWIDQTVQK
jgi:hypothetical protein